ncbi:hypothetical protein U9M48_004726 [Paspalum notatum var. saurae]|uniref:Uncharacterized protein n=1 Tax=Paspalum notatum var. saurae TaxID=547442 RepID=A0AAQ3SJA9_PASNO
MTSTTQLVGSAVVQEACSQALSSLSDRYRHGKPNPKGHMERMEMAHIKLEAALETSGKWNVTSVPLLQWRTKLKRAAQECDSALRRRKRRLREEEETARSSSFPRRIARSAKSFLSSLFITRGDDDDVRRFEWFADSASEFMSFVELGGAPRRDLFFHSLVRHLLAGKGIEHNFVSGGQRLLFLLQPFLTQDHGVEGRLMFILTDGNVPENNFILGLFLRLYESTDVVGVAVRCMQLFMPHHLRSIAEAVEIKLTQLPTQDFCWVPSADSSGLEHWNNLHAIVCKWFRPNPACCQSVHDHHQSSESSLPCAGMYLEPVTKVCLQGHVPLSAAITGGEACCPTRGSQYLKFDVVFLPHASSKDLPSPAAGGTATEMINGDAADSGLYANISFEQMVEIMLPKAVECLRRNAGATAYQMVWRSNHGGAYLRVEKTAGRRRATNRNRKDGAGNRRLKLKRRGNKLMIWRCGVTEFIGSLVALAPIQLQGLIVDWIQKEKKMHSALK